METTTTNNPETPQTQPSVWSIGLKGGLITGLILAIFTIVFQYIMGYLVAWWLFVIPLIAYVIGIVMTHKSYKNEGNGYMSYGTGLGLACILGLISGLVVGLLAYLYVNVIDPSIAEKQADAAVNMQIEMLESMGASDSDIDKALDRADEQREDIIASSKNPLTSVGYQMLSGLAFAFFLSLIISIFTKENEPEYQY